MIDRDRTFAKLDDLGGYLAELRSIVPATFEEYRAVDVCSLLVGGLRLGLPGDENDLFEKLTDRRVISRPMADVRRRMKGMRNILVHEYGRVADELIFETVSHRLGDFDTFKREIVTFLESAPRHPSGS